MSDLTRENSKVVLSPIDHFSGPRFSRRSWRAALDFRFEPGTSSELECEHRMGHRTVDAAKSCGISMWKKLPPE